jgi:hypothetical protein
MTAQPTLDVLGWKEVELFYNVNSARFLLLPLECEKCDTSHYPVAHMTTPAPMEAVKGNTILTNRKQGICTVHMESAKQIPIV